MSFNLPNSWQWLPFEKLLAEPLRNGIYKKKEFHGRGCKIVNMGELFAHPRLKDGVEMKRVELNERELKKSTLKKGDLIFARRSLTAEGAGKCSIILSLDESTTFESSIIRARLNSDIANPEFYYYVFNSPFGKWLLGTILRQVAVAGITGSDLAKLEVPVPPKKTQDEIVVTGRLLDDKIELNRQTNQTLEQIAQTLFKSWFVDFEPTHAKIAANQAAQLRQQGQSDSEILSKIQQDPRWTSAQAAIIAQGNSEQAAIAALNGGQAFDTLSEAQQAQLKTTAALFPDTLVDSELGEIPEGWEASPLSSWGRIVCGKTPSKKKAEYYGGKIPFIKIPDMHGKMYAIETLDSLSQKGADTQKKKLVPEGSICVSCIATVGQVLITTEDSFTNQQINSIVPDQAIHSAYLYYSMLGLSNLLHDLASGGSTTLNLNTGNFSKIEIIRPKDEILEEFSSSVGNLMKQILENYRQDQNLEDIRCTLLPKLLSGELKFEAASEVG
ncbi:restriction endonuclease subunit S [Microbulbifer sp. GL-2]|uniref:restriction endonuclease subunit S n=1 Tax=Microbulbifer sp. GL-2 TaxID=2591606 RepID=UPI0011657999|nr:restriction endonuclease subunit S [Microbulbifer sp. GL-2]BBM01473.1 putative type-1 restriction enzyme HindVIIP specificity protein [Microbulbifer sp. GL-2]